MSGHEPPGATAPREARNSTVQGRFEHLRTTVGNLEILIDELGGKENGEAKKGDSPMEPFSTFWENLPERLDGIANRLEKSTEEIRQMIL